MTRKRGDSYPVDTIETVRRMFLDLYAVDGGGLQDSHSVSAYLLD